MYLEALGRQMAVCSFDGAARLISADKGYWNVVSICGPREQRAELRQAKSVQYACFDDVEEPSAIYRAPRAEDIAEIFGYIRQLGEGPPPPPLLIHCAQGISRSTGVALVWIFGHLSAAGGRIDIGDAIDLLLELRPQAKPNRLVLSLGLAQFMSANAADRLAEQVLSEPRLVRNRFQWLPAE